MIREHSINIVYLADKLEEFRLENDISIRELARLASCSVNTIQKVRGGKEVTPRVVKRVSEIIGVPLKDVMEYRINKEQPLSSGEPKGATPHKKHSMTLAENPKALLGFHKSLIDNPQINKLLSAIVCFNHKSINPELVALVCGMDWEKDKKQIREDIRTLDSHSILQRRKDGRIGIHKPMREALISKIKHGELEKIRKGYVSKLQGWFREHNEITALKTTAPEIPHIVEAAKLAYDHNFWPDSYDLCIDLGKYYKLIGRYKESLKWLKKSEAAVMIESPDDQAKLALSYNEIGLAWASLGEHKRAVEYVGQALGIDEEYYGERHPNVAITLNNLGSAWRALGEYKKAVEYYEQALAIEKEHYGEQYPSIATTLNNLGGVWNSLRDYNKAIEHYEQALGIDREYYGERHPTVAIRLNNLGSAWRSLGKNNKAIEYFKPAYNILVEFLGEEHPNTRRVKENLEGLG